MKIIALISLHYKSWHLLGTYFVQNTFNTQDTEYKTFNKMMINRCHLQTVVQNKIPFFFSSLLHGRFRSFKSLHKEFFIQNSAV